MGGVALSLFNVTGNCFNELHQAKALEWYTHYPFHKQGEDKDGATEVRFGKSYFEYMSEEDIQARIDEAN